MEVETFALANYSAQLCGVLTCIYIYSSPIAIQPYLWKHTHILYALRSPDMTLAVAVFTQFVVSVAAFSYITVCYLNMCSVELLLPAKGVFAMKT